MNPCMECMTSQQHTILILYVKQHMLSSGTREHQPERKSGSPVERRRMEYDMTEGRSLRLIAQAWHPGHLLAFRHPLECPT